MAVTREAFRFMLENAGYATPPGRAVCALELARAEQLLTDAIAGDAASIEWIYDEEPYDQGDSCTDDEARAKFESNEWVGPFGCIVKVYAEPAEHVDTLAYLDRVADAEASLFGIVVGPRGTDDSYCRVVAAELASELLDELRQAIGDALDAATCSLV